MRNDTLIVTATQRRGCVLSERDLKPNDRNRKLFKRRSQTYTFVFEKCDHPHVFKPETLTILEGDPLQFSHVLVTAPGLQTEFETLKLFFT